MISSVLSIITVVVISVSSADTIVVYEPTTKQTTTVILANIDCPEQKQAYFDQSRLFAYGLLQNQKIGIQQQSRQGNISLVNVYHGSLYVNEYLVKMGYCWSYFTVKPEIKEFEKNAREIGIGLWGLPNPIPPWEFRRKNKT